MTKSVLISFCAVMCLTPSVNLYGQTTTAEWEAYWARNAQREAEQLARKVALTARRAADKAALTIFADSKRSKEDRLAAIKNVGWPEPEMLPALLSIGADQSQDDDIRWLALWYHRDSTDKWFDAALKILADPKDGGEELDAKLATEVGRRPPYQQPPEAIRLRIQATLWMLFNDPRDKVRLNAFQTAVALDDPAAMNQLVESLRKGKDFPIPLRAAIHLVARTPIHQIDTLRPYLNHPDPDVQAVAVGALTVDPESRPKIVAIVKNPNAPEIVRTHALDSLVHHDPNLASYALPLMENIKENPKVRLEAMGAVIGRMNWHKTKPAVQIRYAEAVGKIAADKKLTTDDERKLREDAEELVPVLRERFPEIKKHYEKR